MSEPPPPVPLTWSLSYQQQAYECAQPFIDQLKEGETIFLNYWIRMQRTVHYAWLEKKNGILKEIQQTATLEEMPRNWTYEGVCPPYKF